jgi:hypothetical protein
LKKNNIFSKKLMNLIIFGGIPPNFIKNLSRRADLGRSASGSVTRVPVVQIEQMRAHLKGLSARIVMSSGSMVTCASGLLPNPAKVPYFQYKAWWYSIVQKFHNEGKKFQESQFWGSMLYIGHDPAKVPKI